MCNETTSSCMETTCIETTLYRNDRVPTSFLHSCPSRASLEACPQLRFRDFRSASVVFLQADFRWPPFLLPTGVHLRASWEMLVNSLRSTWQIYVRKIPLSSSCVSLKSLLLEIFLGQKICTNFWRRDVWKLCSFFRLCTVILQHSDP